MTCGQKCEVYSRIVGYFRPIANWNIGKKEEFAERQEYDGQKALLNEFAKDEICTLAEEAPIEALKA